MNNLIALYSSAPQMGKSTVASRLQNHGFTVVSFARPVKDMVAELLRYQGVDEEDIYESLYGRLKAIPHPFLGGKSAREALQFLGTEWGRQMLGENLWVDAAAAKVANVINAGGKVVIDDMRFPNEIAMVRRLGGIAVRVDRKTGAATGGHASEGALDNEAFDWTIENYGTLDDLIDDADALANGRIHNGVLIAQPPAKRPFKQMDISDIDHLFPAAAAERSRYVGGHGVGEPT